MPSETQAVIFDKHLWTCDRARAWLRAHKYKPIKRVHVTGEHLRYRLHPPNYRQYVTKDIGDGIKLVLGFK